MTWNAALVSFVLHQAIVLTLIPIVLLRRKEPAATLAWIFAIILMPFVGALGFLFFGNTRLQRQVSRHRERKKRVRVRLAEIVRNLESPIDVKGQLQLYRLLEQINSMAPTKGNEIDAFTDIAANYDLQIAAINAAKHHVHIQYYIFQADDSGKRFREALVAAAQRGVQIRFLYDAVGCLQVPARFFAPMQAAGVEMASFIPVRLFTNRWIFNFRNHRKILIVDGEVGFTGGSNIGDEYLGLSSIGIWRDTHLRVRGPAVLQLQRVFAEDWAFASGHDLTDPVYFPEPAEVGQMVAQVIPAGPDLDVAVFHELYFSAVANAVERIRIQTPYFVPSESLFMALITAARRGVDVRIMMPGKSTHAFVQSAGRSYYEELLEAGVKLYEFTPGFLHSKLLTVDSRWCCVGTANFDNRSMRLNFEIGVAMYNTEMTHRLDRSFDDDQLQCIELAVDTWSRRPLVHRIGENFARLFSSIL